VVSNSTLAVNGSLGGNRLSRQHRNAERQRLHRRQRFNAGTLAPGNSPGNLGGHSWIGGNYARRPAASIRSRSTITGRAIWSRSTASALQGGTVVASAPAGSTRTHPLHHPERGRRGDAAPTQASPASTYAFLQAQPQLRRQQRLSHTCNRGFQAGGADAQPGGRRRRPSTWARQTPPATSRPVLGKPRHARRVAGPAFPDVDQRPELFRLLQLDGPGCNSSS